MDLQQKYVFTLSISEKDTFFTLHRTEQIHKKNITNLRKSWTL